MTFFVIGLATGLFVGVVCARASYHNGVTDGYGYSVDPACPGYWRAGRYLRKYMRHRWPSVQNGSKDDPEA